MFVSHLHIDCNPNGKPYTYCPGYISIINNEISSFVVLSHWEQDNIRTSFTNLSPILCPPRVKEVPKET